MEYLKQHVPSLYFEGIACHCYIKAIACQSLSDIVVVCMSNGTLIEFSQKQVLKTCEIKNCAPEDVQFFVCYKPYCVFYVVKSGTNVYIVKKETCLKVSHVFNKVKKVVKNDFWKVGFPQIGLWYCDKEASEHPHFVTDLSYNQLESEERPSQDEFSVLYNERLKEIRMKCAQLKRNFEEKRKLRQSCTQQLLKNELEEDICDQLADDLHLVTVFGEKDTSKSKSQKPVCHRLEMRKVWQKVHNEKWIVGVQVVNKGKIPIVSTKLLLKLKNGQSLDCKTYFYTIAEYPQEIGGNDSYRSLLEQWKCTEKLCTDVLSTAIGVLKLSSCQLDIKLVLSAVITYRLENDLSQRLYQLPVPDLEIDMDDIVRSALVVFQNIPTVCEEDLLSILVSSNCFRLLTSESVTEIVKKKFGFSSLLDYGRYYNSGDGLKYFAGVFLESWHTGHKVHLALYTRNSSQALSVVHSLYSALSHGAYIVPFVDKKSPDLQKMYCALEAEINLTVEQLSEWEEKFDVVEGYIYIPRKEYFQYKSRVFNLEKNTDELDVQTE